MEGVSASSGSLQVKAKVTTASEDSTLEDNVVEESLPLIARADLTVAGKSAQEMYSYIDLGNEGQRIKIVPFILQYQIEKFDVSPVQEVEFSIFYPSAAVDAPSIEIVQGSENQKYECATHCLGPAGTFRDVTTRHVWSAGQSYPLRQLQQR
ncbi:hypothetical protein B566_EDAN014650 [Ephemera danica]|nr:hypothetical protein B566_EDAN014650 [Ephemera danica]